MDSNEVEVSAPFADWMSVQNESGSGTSLDSINEEHNPAQPVEQKQNEKGANTEIEENQNPQEPKTDRLYGLEAMEQLKKRGYRSTDISANFWKALKLHPPSLAGASKMVVIPVIYKKASEEGEEESHKCLVERAGRHNNALVRIQISAHDSGTWSPYKAKELLVSETTQALSKLLKYGKGHPPPISKWKDVSWHYKWSINKHHGTLGCTWLAIAKVSEDSEIFFHKPGKHIWSQLPEAMEELVKSRQQGEVEHLPNDFFTQLMGQPVGSQDSSPPKPALKKSKKGTPAGKVVPKTSIQTQAAGLKGKEGTQNCVVQNQDQGEPKSLAPPENHTNDVRA